MYVVRLFANRGKDRRLRDNAGSTLIWALIVVLVISLILAAGLNMVQRQQNANVTAHIENQAYFSAMSVDKAIVNWLSGTVYSYEEGTDYAGGDRRAEFINWVLKKDANKYIELQIDGIDSVAFPDALGTIKVYVMRDNDNNLYVKTTATYLDETRTVTGMVTDDPSQIITGGLVVEKMDVPPPPEFPDPAAGELTLLNSGAVSGTAGTYYTTNRTASLTGTMDTLVVQGSSNFTFGGTADTLVVMANATVTIGNPAHIGRLIIEDGGKTNFISNSKLYGVPPEYPVCELYVMPGGSFLNTANGNNQADIMIYAYASNDPKKIAVIQLRKMQVSGIIVQATGEYGGYSANMDLTNDVKFSASGVIHLPIDYNVGGVKYDLTNWDKLPGTILDHVCNPPLNGSYPKEAPFCPHFLAINEPPVVINTDSWGGGGFWSD